MSQRYGIAIGLKPEHAARYIELHRGPGVRDLLHAANIRNFSIFLCPVPGSADGQLLEFGVYDYVGSDYAADMAALAADPRNVAWLARCSPMQLPLPGHASWMPLECIFDNP